MKKALLFICISFCLISQIAGQCYCEDCPEDIIFGAPSSALLNISGATNNTLGQNGQSLINVGVSFVHDAAQELSLRLVAPDGSFVDLTIGEGLDFGPSTYFDLNFLPCSGVPSPDCTNNSTWTSTDIWDEGPYYGSYFPESGCLEDLTGDLNGQWQLLLEDVFAIEDGELYCFDLTFADGTGISCSFSGCGEMPCIAQSGIGISPDLITAPQGDPSLLIDFTVIYGPCEVPAPSPEYIYIYVIYEPFPGNIIEIQQGTVDLTGYAPGQYFVQGFSILASDLPLIEALDFSTSMIGNVTALMFSGAVCGDNNFDASLITIENCTIGFTGSLQMDVITAEVGDPSLDPSWIITWSPSAPDFNLYGLYYVVYDQVTGVIIDYLSINDFTGLPAGDYDVSVVVFSLTDESNLPPVNGVSVFQDILVAITNGDICAITFGDNQLFISEPCTIDANGMLEQEDINAPQNDPLLNPDWDITFSGTTPDPALYGFYFLVVNADTDLLVAYYTTDDFTLLLEGNYYVVVIYYLLADLAILPPPNGANTFADVENLINNDQLCAQYFGLNSLVITEQCLADAGIFNPLTIDECEGSINLSNTIEPDYSPGSGPGSNYSYVYIVSQNGLVIEVSPDADFTDLAVGLYEICGYSYLTTDGSQIPVADGSFPVSTIDQLNIDGTICGDITDDCVILQIFDLPEPVFTGPIMVCAGVLYTYEIGNYTGDINDYQLLINMGGFTEFFNDPSTGEYFINWLSGPGELCLIQTEGICEGDVCLSIDVDEGIMVDITGDDEICEGDQVIYTITPLPQVGESYNISLSGGTVVSQADPLVTVLWDGVAPYSITAELVGGDCGGSETLDITVIDPVDFPTVTFLSTSCTGTPIFIPEISDPLILDWEWTATNADLTFDGTFVEVNWIDVGAAEVCLEIETECDTEQMCYDIDIIQSPEPTIDPLTTVCELMFVLEATPNTGTSWIWTTTSPNVIFSDPTNFVTDVTVTGPGSYDFVLEEIGGLCSTIIETTVIVEDGLMVSSPTYDCSAAGTYTVQFTILDGDAPFSVNGSIIAGDLYVSAPIASGTAFSFLVSDTESCEADVIGLHICPCITDAGTMEQDPIELCISSGEDAVGIHNADEIFDNDDQGAFYLHTNNTDILGVVLGQSTTGTFAFDPLTMISGQIYYISFVAGNADGSGVDSSDPCLSISVGQPVVFYDDPTVFAGDDDQLCGLEYNLSQGVSPSLGSWSTESSPIDSDITFTTISGETTVSADLSGVYVFEYSFSDQNGCSGTDQREITFIESPIIENLVLVCDDGEYTVSFDISGGMSPYLVNGNLISGNDFTSVVITSGDAYSFQITDADGCTSEESNGTFLCDCDSDAGTMAQDDIDICAVDGTPFSGTFNNDATVAAGDIGLFFLHTGSSNLLTSIYGVNTTPDFIYDSSFGVGVTLYISYVVGDDIGGAINLTEECLAVSIGQPVNILATQKVEIGDYVDLCSYNIDLDFDDLGFAGQWTVISTPLDANADFEDPSMSNTSIEVDMAGEYIIAWSPLGAGCAIGDSTTLIFESIFQLGSILEDCNNDLTSYNVTLNIEGGSAPYFIDGVETTAVYISDTLLSGSIYSYVVTDSRGCSFDVLGVFDCQCNNEPGTMATDTLFGCVEEVLIATYNQDAILDNTDISQYIIYNGNSTTIDFIIDIVDEPNINYSSDFTFGVVYYIAHFIGDSDISGVINLQDPCIQFANGQPFIFVENDAVFAGDDTVVCGFEVTLNGSNSGQQSLWRLIDSPSGSTVVFDEFNLSSVVLVDQIGTYYFELSSINTLCSSIDTVVLDFVSNLEYQIESVVCLPESYSVVFIVSGGSVPYSIDGNVITGDTFTTQLIPIGEGYSFELSDSGLCDDVLIAGESDCNCESDAGTNEIDLISVCSLSDIQLGFLSNFDFVLDTDDVINWVIHTSDNSELGDVIGVIDYDQVESISFDDFNFEYGVIYYVSTVVGDEGAILNPLIDPCLSVSVGAPFVFEKPIELSSGEDQIFCGSITTLIGTSMDTNTIWKIDDISAGPISWDPDQYNAPLNIFFPGTYSFLLTSLDTECYLTDTVYVTSLLAPATAEVDSLITICNNSSFDSSIDLNDQILSGFVGGRWSMEGGEIDPILDFDGFEAGELVVTYSSSSPECGTLLYDVTITIIDCQCPSLDVNTVDVSCFGTGDGSINITLEEGQNPSDYIIRLNNETYDDLTISDLTAGSYDLIIYGIEDCVDEYQLIIDQPMPVSISLGEDMNVEIDDSVTIVAITAVALSDIGFIQWEDLIGVLDESDLELSKSFTSSDNISIQIEDEAGCVAFDEIRIRISRDEFIFPNTINPNSPTGNNIFSLKDTRGIEAVKIFTVFDRWGNIMYNAENVDPNLATWDGTYNGQNVMNGVYVFQMIVLFDGEEIALFGDITVLR